MDKVVMYFGAQCPHCHNMMPTVDNLIAEGVKIEKKEVWENEANAAEMRQHEEVISKACGGDLGVPAFLSADGSVAICGELTYEELKSWIKDN